MAVPVNAGKTFEAGVPKPLFQTRTPSVGSIYDVSADGQRFLVNTSLGDETSAPITLVLNWTSDLNRPAN